MLKTNASAAAGNGITTTANVSAAIPVRVFKGMRASSVMIFLRRLWKILVTNDNSASPHARVILVKIFFKITAKLFQFVPCRFAQKRTTLFFPVRFFLQRYPSAIVENLRFVFPIRPDAWLQRHV